MSQPRIERGFVAPAVREELPGLGLRYVEVPSGSGRSGPALKRRLAMLSDRFGGRQAIELRSRPIPRPPIPTRRSGRWAGIPA